MHLFAHRLVKDLADQWLLVPAELLQFTVDALVVGGPAIRQRING